MAWNSLLSWFSQRPSRKTHSRPASGLWGETEFQVQLMWIDGDTLKTYRESLLCQVLSEDSVCIRRTRRVIVSSAVEGLLERECSEAQLEEKCRIADRQRNQADPHSSGRTFPSTFWKIFRANSNSNREIDFASSFSFALGKRRTAKNRRDYAL